MEIITVHEATGRGWGVLLVGVHGRSEENNKGGCVTLVDRVVSGRCCNFRLSVYFLLRQTSQS